MNIDLLKQKIEHSGKNIPMVAADVNIDTSTFYRKLQQKGETFTVAQAEAIKESLCLSAQEAFDIFYA